jgi:crotonobetainyl-CoA:carnitine CoA-transferase CaiB-like acyl-CoA transferase
LSAAARPLDGVLVVALEQAVAAPLATCKLADAGARVIKIERDRGDFARHYDTAAGGESAYFAWLNRGKESIVLDIKDDDDRALLGRLLDGADVFVQNLAPGAAARSGFGSEALRRRHPRLITCDISGYGESGPYRDRRAYDLLVQAESGLAAITGRPEGPGRVGVSACDIAAGLYAHGAILESLLLRHRTGVGRAIQVSLFDCMADWMSVPLLHYEHRGYDWPRVGLAHPTIAPYGAFPTRGGAEILIAVQNDEEFQRLASDVLDDASLGTDDRFRTNRVRVENRPELDGLIARRFSALDRAEIEARLERARIAYAAVSTVADLARHPQLRRAELRTPHGTIEIPAAPAIVDGVSPPFGRVPALGEHGDAIRREFGTPATGA